jgi:hypothetical protein
MLKTGSWWLSSKTDKRWNVFGNSPYVGGFEMCEEAKAALDQKKKELGEPPADLEHGYMKD